MQLCELCKLRNGDEYKVEFEYRYPYQWYLGSSQKTRYYVRNYTATGVVCDACIVAVRRADIRRVLVFGGISLLLLLAALLLYLIPGEQGVQWVSVIFVFGFFGIIITLMSLLAFEGGREGRAKRRLKPRMQLKWQKEKLCEQCGEASVMQIKLVPREQDVDQNELTPQLFGSAGVNLSERIVGYRCSRHTEGFGGPFVLEPRFQVRKEEREDLSQATDPAETQARFSAQLESVLATELVSRLEPICDSSLAAELATLQAPSIAVQITGQLARELGSRLETVSASGVAAQVAENMQSELAEKIEELATKLQAGTPVAELKSQLVSELAPRYPAKVAGELSAALLRQAESLHMFPTQRMNENRRK